jgi:hypothetical protein
MRQCLLREKQRDKSEGYHQRPANRTASLEAYAT